MGAIFSRKKKVEETTLEKLEKIETKIKGLEDHIQNDRRREKKIWATFLFTTGFIYVSVAGVLHFFVLERQTVLDYTKLAVIWLAPVLIIYFIQRFIPWYFNRGIQENREKLKKIREEKKKILDSVRENEPYNKAKTILEKYEGPQRDPSTQKQPVPVPSVQRQGSQPYQKFPVAPFAGPRAPLGPGQFVQRPGQPNPGLSQFPMGRPPQMKERGAFDRVLDFIVKDGPENRMALICRACGAHNGLCLLDEYDFTGFRCFECRLPNPPRKPRPSMANLSFSHDGRSGSVNSINSVSPLRVEASGSSESGSNSETEAHNSEMTTGAPVATEAIYKAVVKQTVHVTKGDSSAPVQSVSALPENLVEEDTGSESGDEMESSADPFPVSSKSEIIG